MKQQPIKIDATAKMHTIGRYLVEICKTKYEPKFSYKKIGGKYKRYQKVEFTKKYYEIQWKNILSDFKAGLSPKILIPRLAYVFAGLLALRLGGSESALPMFTLAIAFDAATGAEFTAATSYTVSSFTVTGSNTYGVVSVGLRSATADITGITFNTVAMTELGDVLRAASTLHVWTFGLAGPTSGNVVITGDTSLAAEVVVSTYTGVAQTGSTGTVATADGASDTPSVTVSSATGELVVDAVGWNAGGDGTAGASQTKRAEGVSGNGISMDVATSDEAGAASVTMSWTVTGGGAWVILGVPLKPVAVATFVPKVMMY